MKLRELELKNFGKFHDRKLEFYDGIQLICGENESGKSTIHTFIRAMLFGLERGRGRASLNDTFSRYEPWENGNYYAGILKFECNKKLFNLQRNFDKYSKSASLVCETDGEELSVKDGDLEVLLDGLTESSYENTLYIGQLRAAAGQTMASELKNYATNYYVTGGSDLDFTAAKQELVNRKKDAEREVKQGILRQQHQREKIEQEASYIWRDIHRIDEEMYDVREELAVRERQEEERQDREEADAEWGRKRVTDELRPAKWRVHPVEIIAIIIASILAFVFMPRPWNSAVTIVLILLGIIYIWNRMKIGKAGKTKEERPEDSVLQEELLSTERLHWQLQHLEGERKEKQIEYENLQEHLQELDEIGKDRREANQRREALVLAVNRLEEVSAGMQRQLTGRLNDQASDILRELTGGRYDRLTVDENLHMSVLYKGKRVPMERVSQGTLEQIYFAFRMAAAEILYEEEYPILLDDTFAFYDDERLKRTLRWLDRSGRQVIIFSCQSREEKIMKRAGIRYAKTIL